MKSLFDPIEIAGLKAKNRFFRSATFDGCAEKGAVTPRLSRIYEELARGGVGTIITGITLVSEAEELRTRQMAIFDDSFIPSYRALTDAVHSHGAAIVMQLGCQGAQYNEHAGQKPIWGPSAVEDTVYKKTAREMTKEEISRMEEDFAGAALRAKEAGFDGVQLHVAHGYLLNRFLTPYYNRRTDEYGGSIENRGRAVFETLAAVRKKVGADYPVMVKISCDDFMTDGMTFHEGRYICRRLAELGVDAIEVSGGSPSSRPNESPCRKSDSYFHPHAEKIAGEIAVPVIAVGGNRDPEAMAEYIGRTKVAGVALCRPLIRESGLINRWQQGDLSRALCVSCNKCFNPKGTMCIFNEDAKK